MFGKNNVKLYKYIICLILFAFITHSNGFSQSRTAEKKQKEADQKLEKEKGDQAKFEEKGRRDHYKRQHPTVQKRMDANKKRAQEFNKHNKSTFFQRIRNKRKFKHK